MKNPRILILLAIGAPLIAWAAYEASVSNKQVDDFNRSQRIDSPITRVPALPPPRTQGTHIAAELARLRTSVRSQIENLENTFQAGIAGDDVTDEMTANLEFRLNAARHAARSTYTRQQVRLVMQALRKFLEDQPAAADAPARLSWRVHLLPLLGQQELYDQFRADEPWDSPHNKPLADQMPMVYRHIADDDNVSVTRLLAIDHTNALGAGGRLRPISAVTDPQADTVAILVAGEDLAVPWTRPADLSVNADSYAEIMQKMPQPNYWVGTVEGATLDVPAMGSLETFTALVSIAGGEPGAVDAMIKEKFRLMKEQD